MCAVNGLNSCRTLTCAGGADFIVLVLVDVRILYFYAGQLKTGYTVLIKSNNRIVIVQRREREKES